MEVSGAWFRVWEFSVYDAGCGSFRFGVQGVVVSGVRYRVWDWVVRVTGKTPARSGPAVAGTTTFIGCRVCWVERPNRRVLFCLIYCVRCS